MMRGDMDFLTTIAEIEIAGNRVWRILALFGIILAAFIIGRIARFFLQKSAASFDRRGQQVATTTLTATAHGVVFFLAAAGISLGLTFLGLKAKVAEVANAAGAILLAVGVGYLLYWLVEVPAAWLTTMAGKTKSKLDDMLVPVIRKSLRVTVILLVLVQIAQTLSDKPITSIIAGLGIGGLAFALAAQDSIKNIFGSIVLFVDKPFEIGDRIVVDGHDGPVEEVGLRSTKIRTLDGHLITVPNGQLANKTIQNIGKRPFIKRTADITITYDSTSEKVDRALEILKELLDNHEGMNKESPPRVYFSDFNADSLNLRVIYWYYPPDYWKFMAFGERFNKELFQRFNDEGIEFAFPTQTLFVAGDPARPFTVGKNKEGNDPEGE